MAVFGDGRARLLALPRHASLAPAATDHQGEPKVLHSVPLLETHVPPSTCLTTVRFSPHDPALVVAGASNGAVFLYRIDARAMLRAEEPQDADGAAAPRPPAVLLPVRRFWDGRDNPHPQFGVVESVDWHPSQRDLFAAVGCVGGGRWVCGSLGVTCLFPSTLALTSAPLRDTIGRQDYGMRVWDVRKPFRPLLDKSIFKHCRSVTWVPNGSACLGGESLSCTHRLGAFGSNQSIIDLTD